MRKNYVKPALISEEFVPQTYVAACTKEPGYIIYSFKCNAGAGVTHTIRNGKHYETVDARYNVYVNGVDITGDMVYHPCNKEHTVKVPIGTSVDQVFKKGTMDDIYTDEIETISVYVWRGDNNDNTHCMANPGSQTIDIPKQMS